ncbi:hypothetical protein [Neolewinella agarilytica]|uniref:Transglutaminase-like domain-containing protein n=1 Tax=Neolewinella agarilytica TaxID=478744 RepID=A0A1H9LYA9_9BACT|nr:hypothetical protein [Neolewinella agarilytica]SER16384.1 hypothetical protein SAMN05444359_12635 [Neolewinella agarilytica]
MSRATTLIPPPAKGPTLRKEDYRTKDIVQVVQDVVEGYAHETKTFSRQFEPTRRGLQRLFNWVERHFTYKEDPAGSQWVQTPAYLNNKRVGDCKSYTAFISSVLQNIGVDHLIRYAAYGTREFRHVYPVAILNGQEIPVDVVYKVQHGGRFGTEKRYTKKKDIKVKAGLYQLGSTMTLGNINMNASEEAIIGQLKTTLADIEKIGRELPSINPNTDVTKMTAGELDQWLWADRFDILERVTPEKGNKAEFRAAAVAMRRGDISGIGSVKNLTLRKTVLSILKDSTKKRRPAFPDFSVAIPTPAGVSGLFGKVKDWFKKVGEAISSVFKKFVNWVFNGIGKKMGPFFIFSLLKGRNKVKSPAIKNRIKAQDKTFNFIQKLGKFDPEQLKGLALNGILEQTGKTPQQIAIEGGAPQVGAVITAIVSAITVVVQIVEKIAGIFKKSPADAGTVDQSTMSDPTLFEEEARLQRQANATGQGGGSLSPLLLGGGGLLLLKALA